MDLCPICLENNKHSILVNIGVDTKLLVCESDGCIYLRTEDNSNLCVVTNDNINNLSNENDFKSFSSDLFDLECDLSTTDSDSEYTSFTNKSKLNFSKYKIIPVQRHLSQLIKEADKKDTIFNWFGIPLMLKFHVKICYFLVIHLHLFDTNKHEICDEIKQLYHQCESLVCKLPNRLVSLVSYRFLSVLYEQHHRFRLASFSSLDMSERIIKSMNNFINGMDDCIKYKSVYSFSESCLSCPYVFSYLREDFMVKILDNTFEYSDDFTFRYRTKCRKCFASRMLQVVIKIERLANFIFIVCPEGVNKTFAQLNKVIFEKPFDHNLKLQAIIELKCPASFNDLPEKEPKFEEFILKNACKPKVEFRVHFRNTVSWYCIDTNSGICIDPINETDIRISSDKIRFLIYGELNDPVNSHANEFYPPIYEVLDQFKKSPKGFVKYPSEIIKYWMILFKYRDYCLQKNEYSKSFLNKMSTKIAAKLNSHLKRRQNRIKKKLKEAMKKEKGESQVSFSSTDEENADNQFNEEAHDEVIWNKIEYSEDLFKLDEEKEEEKEEESADFRKYIESSSHSQSLNTFPDCPVTRQGNIKQEATNINDFPQKETGRIFDFLKARREPIKITNERNKETSALLDKLIEMKKRKLDQRDEYLYNS